MTAPATANYLAETATLALNPGSGVLHTWGCTKGPRRKTSHPAAYLSVPVEVLPSIREESLCTSCLLWFEKERRRDR